LNNQFILITYLVSVLFINSAIAQDNLKTTEAQDTKRDTKTFNLVTLDSKIAKVKITPDYAKRVLRITYLKDTITIYDFWGVPPVIQMLNKTFIEIKYEIRGGSNLGLGNILILCVKDNKIIEAMHVLRYTNLDSGNEKMDYHINLNINGNNKSDYSLSTHIHDDTYSKQNPETNYNYNNETTLNFDTKHNVFYSIKQNVYNYIAATKAEKATKQKVNGNFPVIILGKEIYYFINERWYQLGRNDEINEM
jgi:hypothetical protein